MLRLVAQGLGLDTGGVEKARLLDAVEQQARRGDARRQAHPADRRRGAEPAGLGARRAAHALQLPGRRPRAASRSSCSASPSSATSSPAPGLEQLRQRVIATHHLDAMGADEVEPYIRHRLTRVDWQGNPEFEPDAFAAIHRHSGGIPRRVNQLAAPPAAPRRGRRRRTDRRRRRRGGRRRHGRRCRRSGAPSRRARRRCCRSARPGSPRCRRRAGAAVAGRPIPRSSAASPRSRRGSRSRRRCCAACLILLVDWVENGSQEHGLPYPRGLNWGAGCRTPSPSMSRTGSRSAPSRR